LQRPALAVVLAVRKPKLTDAQKKTIRKLYDSRELTVQRNSFDAFRDASPPCTRPCVVSPYAIFNLDGSAPSPVISECRNLRSVRRQLPAKLHLHPRNNVLAVIPAIGGKPLCRVTGTFRPVRTGAHSNE